MSPRPLSWFIAGQRSCIIQVSFLFSSKKVLANVPVLVQVPSLLYSSRVFMCCFSQAGWAFWPDTWWYRPMISNTGDDLPSTLWLILTAKNRHIDSFHSKPSLSFGKAGMCVFTCCRHWLKGPNSVYLLNYVYQRAANGTLCCSVWFCQYAYHVCFSELMQ